MKKFFVIAIVCVLNITTLSAQSQQQPMQPQQVVTNAAPTSQATPATNPVATPAFTPSYTGAFYFEGIVLPHVTPQVKAKFRTSLEVPSTVTPTETGPVPVLIVKVEGSGDPSSVVKLIPIEEGGRVGLKKDSMSSFARVMEVKINPLGNRVFEVKPADTLPVGNYAVALRSDNPFSAPELYLFRVVAK